MSNIVDSSNFNSKNLAFSTPKQLPSGAKQAYVNYNGQKLVMQTAMEMSVPFGLNIADKFGPPEYSVELSFRGNEQNAAIKDFMDLISQIDEKMLEEGVKNSKLWFKADVSRDVVKAFYTPSLKYSKDKEGNVLNYPPNIKLKLRKLNNDFETKFYDVNGNPYKDIPIEDLLVKGVQVTAIMECAGVWFAGSKFGLTWRAKQIAVHKLPEKIADFAFKGFTKVNDSDAFKTAVNAVMPNVVPNVVPNAVPNVVPNAVPKKEQSTVPKEEPKEESKEESMDDEPDDVEPVAVPKRTVIKKKIPIKGK